MTYRKSLLATSILAATLGLTGCGGASNNDVTPEPDTNNAPTAIVLEQGEVKENVTERQEVGTLTATDADSGDSHTFTTSSENFEIEGNKLYVKEGVALDFETAAKVLVSVTTSDGTAEFTADVEVTITDVNEAPSEAAIADQKSVTENSAVNVVLGTLSATDPDAEDTVTFSTETAGFSVDGNTLTATKPVDYEQNKTIDVTVVTTDKAGLKTEKVFTITVEDEMDYDFLSKNPGDETSSNVYYSGQIARHVLIKELTGYIKSDAIKTDVTNGTVKLNNYYKIGEYKDNTNDDGSYKEGVGFVDKAAAGALYSEIWEANPLSISAATDAKQTLLTEVSGSHKDLYGKIAGSDYKGQMKDWNLENALAGWSGLDAANTTPRGLVDELFSQLETNIETFNAGTLTAPNGKEITKHYVTASGVDLQQLIEKFLFGAVAFSQGTDDYLDDSTEGKGLLSGHDETDIDEKGYTKVEHQWDEGYGYFGAARNYLSYTDNEIAGKVEEDTDTDRVAFNGKQDTNADGKFDLTSEFNWGNSTNAAKRDRKFTESGKSTDLTKEAFEAFFKGRKLLNDTAGTALTTEQAAELLGYANEARMAWEQSIVATVIHYINDTNKDLDVIKTGEYTQDNFNDLGKHWAEMKGFALNMQFNPVSPFNKDDTMKAKFVELHTYMGNAPVLTDAAAITAYQAELVKARDILRDAYTWKSADGVALTGADLNELVANW